MSDAGADDRRRRRCWSAALGKRRVTYVLPFVVVAALWQFASLFFPPFLFPSLIDVFKRCIDIFTSWSQFSDVLATVGRILAGLAGASSSAPRSRC